MTLIRTPDGRPQGCCAPVNGEIRLTTVRSRLLGPDGKPLGGREVVAVLRAAPNWMADGSGRVVDTARTRTDPEGWWTMRLVPNKYLEPPRDEHGEEVPTSHYEIKEEGLISTALVPDAGEHENCPDAELPCEVYLRDILIESPPPKPIPWHPIDTVGKLHNVDRDADQTQAGYALLFDGRIWVPGPVASTLGALGNVDPEADAPEVGQALVFDGTRWVPTQVDVTTELARLTDVSPSIHQATVGQPLECIAIDGARRIWGVRTEQDELTMEFGGQAGSMTVIGEITAPDVTEQEVIVYWFGTLEGPTTRIPAGGLDTSYTYTDPGDYDLYYAYADDSQWGVSSITVPIPRG